MAKIAFAWELGGAFGHAMGCTSLAQPLHAAGHEIALIFRELAQLTQLPESLEYSVFQAPRYRLESQSEAQPASYSEILLGTGFGDPDRLATLVRGWRALLGRWGADMLVADSAPCALLAARTLGLRRACYGNGFSIPPQAHPLPAFRVGEAIDARRLAEADEKVLATTNAVLQNFGCTLLENVAELFRADEQLLCSFPELDHYTVRGGSGYWGPRFRFDYGAHRDWPDGEGKRIFVYLTNACPQLDELFACLALSNHRVIAFVPQLDRARRDRLSARRRVVLDRPARLDRLLQTCDLMISHGGDIAAGALMYGVAQLCLPLHYEHYLTARRIEHLGAGRQLGAEARGAELAAQIQHLLANPAFALAARSFSQHHAGFSPFEQRRRIVARLQELLSSQRTSSRENHRP